MPTPPTPSGPLSGPTSKTSSPPPGTAPAPGTDGGTPPPPAPALAEAPIPPAAQAVLDFWFGAPGDSDFCERRAIWFKADAAFDAAVHAQCAALHRDAAAGRL